VAACWPRWRPYAATRHAPGRASGVDLKARAASRSWPVSAGGARRAARDRLREMVVGDDVTLADCHRG